MSLYTLIKERGKEEERERFLIALKRVERCWQGRPLKKYRDKDNWPFVDGLNHLCFLYREAARK
jgi:hypothetical protein